MRLATRIGAAAAVVAVTQSTMTLQARAEDRSRLIGCQALIERAAQAANENGASAKLDDPELARCRQIVREWTLRDARMSVDEKGRPIR